MPRRGRGRGRYSHNISRTTTGTFEPVCGTDKINKNGIQTCIRTKLFNICAQLEFEKKSMEELRLEYYTRNIFPTYTCLYAPSIPPVITPTLEFTFTLEELVERFNNLSKNKKSTTEQEEAQTANEYSRSCADCEKPQHMQCLHCSKHVCMECAQKHVNLVSEQIDLAQQMLANKMIVLEQLVVAAKERVNIERETIIQQADIERDQAMIQIDELHEQMKKKIENKNTRLQQLSLDKISLFIKCLTDEIDDLNENNQNLFQVTCIPSKIHVRHCNK